jgi:hypothetical protein
MLKSSEIDLNIQLNKPVIDTTKVADLFNQISALVSQAVNDGTMTHKAATGLLRHYEGLIDRKMMARDVCWN